MSDLMDTSKVTKTKTKAEDSGDISHNEWTSNQSRYVEVRLPNGKTITGNDVEDNDMLDW